VLSSEAREVCGVALRFQQPHANVESGGDSKDGSGDFPGQFQCVTSTADSVVALEMKQRDVEHRPG